MSKVVINEVTINNTSNDYDNIKIECTYNDRDINTYASRYIASYAIAGGNINSIAFVDWLESLGLSDDDIYSIKHLATSGEYYLQESAKEFLRGF